LHPSNSLGVVRATVRAQPQAQGPRHDRGAVPQQPGELIRREWVSVRAVLVGWNLPVFDVTLKQLAQTGDGNCSV
jgi:hypothetical protein